MGETDVHRNVMFETIETLKAHYAGQQVYVTGNLLVFYRPGDKRRHVSPDTMVVKGAHRGLRLNYLIWQEGYSPNVVIEITSPSTRKEDLKQKFDIYRTEMHVPEYFLFDPKDEYLAPRLQGFRLAGEQYLPIQMSEGRLPSSELGLYLEASGEQLRFFDPVTARWLPTLHELQEQAEEAQRLAEEAQRLAEEAQRRAESENARLLRELDELRRKLAGENS
jgi:Uma2 family endonuclease